MNAFYPLLLLFLCLLPAAGRELTAQNHPDELQKMAAGQYRLTGLKMSENGRWLTAWKSYDLNRDTLLIFDSRAPGNPATCRTKVTGIAFPGANYLLVKSAQQAELLNLEKQTGTYFNGVKQLQALKNKEQFLLHYGEAEKNRLEVRDADGELVNEAGRVSRFFITENDQVYAVAETENSEFEVLRITEEPTAKVYHSPRKISSLTIDPGGQGMMIQEQNPDGTSAQLLYLDLRTKITWPLNQLLSVPFQRAFTEVIREGHLYSLRLWVNKQKEDTSLVDIWQGSDKRLEEKFYPPTREAYYVWEPKNKKLQQLGNNRLTKSVTIGNERYFLSFDPYLLQDYTKTAPLEINSYDRLKNRYALLDTIPREMHVHPDGKYVLYPKSKTWHSCPLPWGPPMVIGSGSLNTPYFATDGKTVLFDSDDGLWSFDPEESQLSKLANFEGTRVRILNGSSKPIPGGFNFFRKTVDPKKPLVLEWSDSLKNEHAYLLWEKGKSKTIIPKTSKRIRFLTYDQGYECFSWVEEDYNLPPRLVCKEPGKQERVLYQSNRQDTAILSLKQEIIFYTNSDRVPLKGILYYPLGYDPSLNYPMVVHIYQIQSNKEANQYPVAAYSQANNDGFNLRLLLEKGYFVYFPDIVYGEKGTGLSALDCVNHALDAISSHVLIDQDKVGLIGHSHGGYETNFIATHSSRFAAYVSGAGNSDIVRSYFSFNYNFLSPFYWQYENGQYEMGKSFSEDKNLYFQNNPIHYADQVNAPVLLWAGKKDQNIDWEQTMEFYIGLKRNNKKVVALFYPNEGHALFGTDACRDLVSRILDWFGYFLKEEETDTGWIEGEIKGDAS
jgi:dipeptidyl aminopeptidase/acylaminoacyl peptidase